MRGGAPEVSPQRSGSTDCVACLCLMAFSSGARLCAQGARRSPLHHARSSRKSDDQLGLSAGTLAPLRPTGTPTRIGTYRMLGIEGGGRKNERTEKCSDESASSEENKEWNVKISPSFVPLCHVRCVCVCSEALSPSPCHAHSPIHQPSQLRRHTATLQLFNALQSATRPNARQ